jgi:hypothetical protein
VAAAGRPPPWFEGVAGRPPPSSAGAWSSPPSRCSSPGWNKRAWIGSRPGRSTRRSSSLKGREKKGGERFFFFFSHQRVRPPARARQGAPLLVRPAPLPCLSLSLPTNAPSYWGVPAQQPTMPSPHGSQSTPRLWARRRRAAGGGWGGGASPPMPGGGCPTAAAAPATAAAVARAARARQRAGRGLGWRMWGRESLTLALQGESQGEKRNSGEKKKHSRGVFFSTPRWPPSRARPGEERRRKMESHESLPVPGWRPAAHTHTHTHERAAF